MASRCGTSSRAATSRARATRAYETSNPWTSRGCWASRASRSSSATGERRGASTGAICGRSRAWTPSCCRRRAPPMPVGRSNGSLDAGLTSWVHILARYMRHHEFLFILSMSGPRPRRARVPGCPGRPEQGRARRRLARSPCHRDVLRREYPWHRGHALRVRRSGDHVRAGLVRRRGVRGIRHRDGAAGADRLGDSAST